MKCVSYKSHVTKGYTVGPGDGENAATQDRNAEAKLNELTASLEKKMQELKKIPTIVVPMQIWHDIPISVKIDSELQFNSHLLDLITIEETANLNMLLHRLLEFAALHDKRGNSPLRIKVRLKQYPQFYPVFPSEIKSFSATSGGTKKISSLEPWARVDVVRKHGVLHLIMEQITPDLSVHLKDGSRVPLSNEHKNAWPLQDSKDTVVVRNRTPSFSLSIWRPLMSDSSSNISGSTLSQTSGTYSAPFTPNPSHTSVLAGYKPSHPGSSSTTVVGGSQSPPNLHPTTEPSRPATSPPIQPSATQSPPPAKRHLPPEVQKFPVSKPASDTTTQPPSATQNPPLIFQPQHPSPSASNVSDQESSHSALSKLVLPRQADQEDAKADVNNQNSGTALPGFKGHNLRSSIGIGASQVRGKEKEKKRGGVFVWMKEKLEKFAG
ncbi:hypothetical protein GALMADRAFT_421873 [Galerina marginata CBS 339.88]|uniref:Uncharacterized protein n=1 Tax=Galerina marginata (strain CBS 339.88) TaxID=685588 RepID=A0A067T1J4_GALM3|nr:hypothetical protein GALMADRAFT_421873 [Galerina marginata CBS 339.88]